MNLKNSLSYHHTVFSGEYDSHWKLQENGMPFGARVRCSITVVPRETLEPSTEQTDSLKLVMEASQKSDTQEVRVPHSSFYRHKLNLFFTESIQYTLQNSSHTNEIFCRSVCPGDFPKFKMIHE